MKTIMIVLMSLIISLAHAGNAHKGPKAKRLPIVTGEEFPEAQIFGAANLAPVRIGPGDSIGLTIYDFGSNHGPLHNIINYADAAVAVGRMAEDAIGFGVRGTYYTFSSDMGATWLPFTMIETARSGWGNIAQISDAGGVEVTVSHIGNRVNVDVARGAATWSGTSTGSADLLWPRLAVGSGFYIHFIGSRGGGPANTDILYTRLDGQFPIINMNIFALTDPSGPDAYDIAAQGTNLAVVSAEEASDVLLATSSNGGTTWTDQKILDVAQPGELPLGEEEFHPDGSSTILYDNTGNVHAVWSNWLAVGDYSNNPEFFYSIDVGFSHWSSATGTVTNIPLRGQDPNLPLHVGSWRNGNWASSPDLGIDANDNLYVVYSQVIPELDDSGNTYEHVYGVGSVDGGMTWGMPVDLTPGTRFEASFPSVADVVDTHVYFTYLSDHLAGNCLFCPIPVPTAVMYRKVMASILTDVRQTASEVPSAFVLRQNYPNPFNPTTTIQYWVPTEAFVTLKIYNLLGREVATLVNEEKEAGLYHVEFDGTALASGVYLYRLRAGDYFETKKLVLLK